MKQSGTPLQKRTEKILRKGLFKKMCVPHHQKIYKQQMLERVWRKGNPLALLVGMKIDTATVENSMWFLKKLKTELPYDPAIPLLGIYPEKTIIQKDT